LEYCVVTATAADSGIVALAFSGHPYFNASGAVSKDTTINANGLASNSTVRFMECRGFVPSKSPMQMKQGAPTVGVLNTVTIFNSIVTPPFRQKLPHGIIQNS
jgi:hypothetical protein